MAIYAGANITVGLRADGTVFAVGDSSFGKPDLAGWHLFFQRPGRRSSRLGKRDSRIMLNGLVLVAK